MTVSTWSRKRAVKRRYDLTAQMYDERYSEEQEAKYQAALQCLSLSRDSAVLDVGCGTGLFFRHAIEKAKALVGVDISRTLLLKARDRAKACGNIYVVQADADHLPFRDAFFRSVFVFTVLQNMPKPVETLREAKRALRQDGSLVVTGLKKAISLKALGRMLTRAGLRVVFFKDDEALRCYVTVNVKT
ncbi:MAG: class I SAM-dependent methyltransferase [Candidatus Bathyarchaeia archaeon]